MMVIFGFIVWWLVALDWWFCYCVLVSSWLIMVCEFGFGFLVNSVGLLLCYLIFICFVGDFR